MKTLDPAALKSGPLRGIRVLDFSQRIAGPYATKLLSDYGAEVVKVEPPSGDPCRSYSPICPGNGRPHSALFQFLNAGKQKVSINAKDPAGRELLLRLAANADLVVESFRPGTMASLGLGFDDLTAVKPDALLLSVSSYGQKGTFRNYLATELNVFALGGRMAASGTKPRPPVRLLAGSSLFLAGNVAATAAMAALHGRDRSGEPDHIDVSIANVILGEPDRGLCLFSYSGTNVERPDGPRPFQTFPAADGFVVINVNRGIERVAAMIGHPEIASDPRFANNVARQENSSELEAFIMEWTVPRTKKEIVEASRLSRVICAPVATMREVLENEHLHARDFFRRQDNGTCECRSTGIGPPFRIHTCNSWGWTPRQLEMEIGSHSMETLQSLGLKQATLEVLKSSGTVRTDTKEGELV